MLRFAAIDANRFSVIGGIIGRIVCAISDNYFVARSKHPKTKKNEQKTRENRKNPMLYMLLK